MNVNKEKQTCPLKKLWINNDILSLNLTLTIHPLNNFKNHMSILSMCWPRQTGDNEWSPSLLKIFVQK